MLLRTVLYQNARFLSNSSVKCAVLNEAAIKKQDYYKNIGQTQGEENARPADWENAKPFKSIPGPKPLPLIGNTFRFLPMGKYHGLDIVNLTERLHEEYGDIVLVRGLSGTSKDSVFLFLPEYVEMVFRNDGIWPRREGAEGMDYFRRHIRNDVFGDAVGVVTSQGEEWFKARTAINPILMQPRSVELYTEKIDEITQELIENIKYFAQNNQQGEMPADFNNELNKWSLESIAVVALNTRIGCLKRDLKPDSQEQQFINSVMSFLDLFFKVEIMPNLWRVYSTPTWKQYVKHLNNLTNTVLKYVEQANLKDEAGKQDHELSMIQRLIKVDKKVAMTMAIDMLQAGVDTTSKTLATTLFHLATNPEAQQKLRKEAIELLPNTNSPVTKDVLKKDTYTKAVIKESNRLTPVIAGTGRNLSKDQVIGGYQLPKGTPVMMGNYLMSRSEKYYTRAKEFIPERWLRTSSDDLSHKNAHPFVTLPFGFGQRSCVGKRIAMMELETSLLKIVRNFELNWPYPEPVFQTSIIRGIASPLKFHVKEVKE